jgi:ATP-dependent Clp protease ATP-binding subunit ClpA
MSTTSIGFVTEGSKKGEAQQAVTKLFSPEFRNRLDGIISFAPLDTASVEKVVDKLIGELEDQLAEKRVSIVLTPESRSWLAKKGYDPIYGARPLRRLIMKEIGDVLTEEILFGELNHGGEAKVDFKDEKLSFAYTK